MMSSTKTIAVLISVLILSACGGGDSGTGDTANITSTDTVQDTQSDTTTVNDTPVISGTPSTSVDEGDTYSFRPVAYDPDGDSLTFSIENLPAWADFDTSTGEVSGTLGLDTAGVYSNLVIHVTDGSLSAELPAYTIVVNDVSETNTDVTDTQSVEMAPTLVSAAVTGTDVVLSWTQDGLVPDGGYDVFVDGVDTGSQYRTTGLTASIGGLDLEATHCFTVESRYTTSSSFYSSNQLCTDAQLPANQAPTISGTPLSSVVAGVEYTFTPSADDPDNDTLSFSVSNLPSWASFDAQSGTLSGLPDENDVGTYADIVISVSDGEETASLTPFAVDVASAQVSTGTLSLRWIAPTTRADGSVLDVSEIDGYCIYIGETADTLQMEVDLNDGTADSYTISDLPVGTYVVALTVYDMEGNASSYSNTVEVAVTN